MILRLKIAIDIKTFGIVIDCVIDIEMWNSPYCNILFIYACPIPLILCYFTDDSRKSILLWNVRKCKHRNKLLREEEILCVFCLFSFLLLGSTKTFF